MPLCQKLCRCDESGKCGAVYYLGLSPVCLCVCMCACACAYVCACAYACACACACACVCVCVCVCVPTSVRACMRAYTHECNSKLQYLLSLCTGHTGVMAACMSVQKCMHVCTSKWLYNYYPEVIHIVSCNRISMSVHDCYICR